MQRQLNLDFIEVPHKFEALPCFFCVKALEIGDDDDTARSKRLVGVAACSSQMAWIDRLSQPTSDRRSSFVRSFSVDSSLGP